MLFRSSLDVVAPLKQVRFNTKPQKRDSKLTSARATFMKAKRALLSKAIDVETYNTAHREYRREIRRCQRDNYRDFIETINDTDQISKLMRNRNRSSKPIGLLTANGITTRSGSEVLDRLFEVHFPGSVVGESVPNPDGKVNLSIPLHANKVAFITKDKVIKKIGRAHV